MTAFAAMIAVQTLPHTVVAQTSGGVPNAAEVRGLGQLERVDMVPVILPYLSSSSAEIRAEAANALAQSLWPLTRAQSRRTDDSTAAVVAKVLRARLADEREPAVIASIAQALGRLPYASVSERAGVEAALAEILATTSDPGAAEGAARGVLSLFSGAGRSYTPSVSTLRILRSISSGDEGAATRGRWSDTSFVWPRRLAMLALLASRSADTATVRATARSGDAQLRMLAARGLATSARGVAARSLLRALAHDSVAMVRTEVARVLASAGEARCELLLPLAEDGSPQTSVTAIDAMGSACSGARRAAAERALTGLVRQGTGGATGAMARRLDNRVAMHRAAHAIVALARLSPRMATSLLPRVSASPAWQARMYAAHAAAVLSDTAMLLSLSVDSVPNVQSEAIAGLSRVAAHGADSVYIRALSSADYQVVLNAAHALLDTPHAAAAIPALEKSLSRMTAEKRETSRDPRMALLQTLRNVGSPRLAGDLLPYLVDFDSAIADTAAVIVSAWTGREYRSAPRPLAPVDEPLVDIAALASARVRVTMSSAAGGGSFELRLFPDDAPLAVSRFVRLARAGYYDSLTIHRVVPDFVVQGGSPGANEYVGDGPFLRDEVGLRSHRRGAVGISTRGRNTGDAQFFVDLVDLPRLDHDYTVFAEVASGMSTVDGVLEGDVMERVEVITAP